MTANEIIQYCMGLSEKELVKYVKENYDIVYKAFRQRVDDEGARSLITGSILTCVAIDGKFTVEEWKLVKKAIGGYFTYNQALKDVEAFGAESDDISNKLRQLYTILTDEARASYIKICLAVASVDKEIVRKEADLLNKIMGITK